MKRFHAAQSLHAKGNTPARASGIHRIECGYSPAQTRETSATCTNRYPVNQESSTERLAALHNATQATARGANAEHEGQTREPRSAPLHADPFAFLPPDMAAQFWQTLVLPGVPYSEQLYQTHRQAHAPPEQSSTQPQSDDAAHGHGSPSKTIPQPHPTQTPLPEHLAGSIGRLFSKVAYLTERHS